jgi:hypothetical protein
MPIPERTFTIEFDGYWRESNKSGIPSEPGVFCVYECAYKEDKTLLFYNILFIGQSENINERVMNSEQWHGELSPDRQVCFSAAMIPNQRERDIIEACLVSKHSPLFNQNISLPPDLINTRIISNGKTALLNTDFTINSKYESFAL